MPLVQITCNNLPLFDTSKPQGKRLAPDLLLVYSSRQMEAVMRLIAGVAAVLISGSMALAQQIKEPVVHVRPAPGTTVHHSVVTPPPVNNSSATELTRIEQQTARVRTAKPVAHHSPTTTTTNPALDLGKNKPIRVIRSPEPTIPSNH